MKELTETETHFLTLAKRYEQLKNDQKQLKEAMSYLLEEMGEGAHFQDPETKAVYKIVKPNGTFVHFDSLSYERTRLDGEQKGSLSLKKAEELGYNLG